MFKVEWDTSGLSRKVERLGYKQLAYAAVNATNDAAKLLQIELQHDARQRFTIRNEFTIRQAAVINPFASVRQQRIYADIGVAIGKLQPKRLFLAQYEQGGPRADVAGSAIAAAPVIGGPARPSFRSKVPAQYRYRSLQIRKRKKDQRRGRQRTFVIEDVGVFQRTGPERRDIRMVYAFSENDRLPDMMRFREVVMRFAPGFMRAEFERHVAKAIAYANL